MKNKLVKIGSIFILILINICNAAYAMQVTEENAESVQDKYSILFEITIIITGILIVGHTLSFLFKRKDKNYTDENTYEEVNLNSEFDDEKVEINKKNENKIWYLIANIIILIIIILWEYIFMSSRILLYIIFGIGILIILVLYNWNSKLTYLDRFNFHFKLLALVLVLFFYMYRMIE